MSPILILVCYMWLPDNYEECTILEVSVTVKVYCQRAHQLSQIWDEIEITKCEQKEVS
ncbi:hypothetical protein LCGC14_1968660 [marine sediment metagenome]|uniref:Uncharacterized protein n=1 Tax=marine sediment metagenome TaxID=412755 RepID=A0A0F9FCF1_9ZZZZ